MPSITSKPAKPAYKHKLIRAKELQGNACAILYDRISLLVEVYNDPQFHEFENLDEFTAASRLDAYLTDVAENFITLKAVLELFPERETWEKRTFRELLAHARGVAEEKRRKAREPQVAAHRVTKQELKQVAEERDDAIKVAESAQETAAELRRENDRLKKELAVAEYRIKELEEELSSVHAMA